MMEQNELERITNERAQLQEWVDKNHNGSYWKAAKAIKIPHSNMALYLGAKTKGHSPVCDLRKIKIVSKSKLYHATGLEFLDPMNDLPENLNEWQKQLYAVMVREEISPTIFAKRLGVKESTVHNYFDDPMNLENIRDKNLRNAIYKAICQSPVQKGNAEPASPSAPKPAPAAPASSQPAGLDGKIDQQLAMIAKVLPCAFPNGSAQGLVDGTRQLVQFLNQNLERYGSSTAAQELLRKDRATLELFGRCHELLSAVYQNNPFTAHRLSTIYNPREERK